MSDHDTDPMDQAYAQAEALLDDDAARAARRARVLAAVAEAAPVQAEPASPSPNWRRGGWLVAAGVAGVSVFVATQINRPPTFERPSAPPAEEAPHSPTRPAAPPATDPAQAPSAAVTPPAISPPARAPEPSARARPAPSLEAAAPARAVPAIPPLPLPPVAAPPPPPPPPPAASPVERRISGPAAKARAPGRVTADESSRIEEVVVTGSKIERPPEDVPLADISKRSLDALSERLRDAAAAGQTREISALLSRGVPIDAADGDGETALMKAVQAKQRDATALLRRRGASLDLKNQEGRSARDMAAALADPELDRALGLDR